MRRPVKLALAAAVVAAAGAGLWWFFSDDAPPPVALDTAVESVGDTAGPGDGIEGTWAVDTTSGAFDFDTATGTFAGFRIEEELSTIGSTTAVGRTGDVTGEIVIDGTTVTDAGFEVDLTTITTNQDRRNSRVQDALETGRFPTATFTLTEPIELPAAAADGDAVSAIANGALTLHGVTELIAMPVEAQLVEGTVVVVGSIEVVFSDYGVEVPKAPIVLSVTDHGVLELQLLLTKS